MNSCSYSIMGGEKVKKQTNGTKDLKISGKCAIVCSLFKSLGKVTMGLLS